jgi:hypothetical protein
MSVEAGYYKQTRWGRKEFAGEVWGEQLDYGEWEAEIYGAQIISKVLISCLPTRLPLHTANN